MPSCDNDAAIAAALQAEENSASSQRDHSRGPEAAARSTSPTLAWPPRPDEEAGQAPAPAPAPVDDRTSRRRLIGRIAAVVSIVVAAGIVFLGYLVVTGHFRKRAVSGGSPGIAEDDAVYEDLLFENISRGAFDATNNYRDFKGLASLVWHQGLASIATDHAAEMAEGVARFSHEGFDDRVSQYPFSAARAAENLGQCRFHDDVAQCAVSGWIRSPLHEKNLVGDFDLCGIGTAYNAIDERWFLTQLFAASL